MSKISKNLIPYIIIILTLFQNFSGTNDFVCKHPQLEENPTVEIGDKLMLCTFFLPFMIKLRYHIEVDKQEVLHGRHLWKFFENRSVDVLAQVGNTRKFSQQTPYMRDNGTFAYPVMIFTIILHKGIIIDIRTENMEELCKDSSSNVKNLKLKSNISLPLAIKHKKKTDTYCHVKCDEEEYGEKGKCDPKILITWQGTDKNNNLLLSHSDSLNTYTDYNKLKAFNVIMNLYQSFDPEEYTEENIRNDIKARLNKI